MTSHSDGSQSSTSRPWTSFSSSSRQSQSRPSVELEKLLTAAIDTTRAHASVYNVETMVDELLASTWEPVAPAYDTKASLVCRVSLTSPSTSLSALQNVLAESIDRLIEHRKVVSNRIAELEQDSRRVSSNFQKDLVQPDLLLSVGELGKRGQEDCSCRLICLVSFVCKMPNCVSKDICVQMEDLEERFTKVSSSAVLIGDKLSMLDEERSRVLETDELMETLLTLNDPSAKLTKSSNRMFDTLHDPNQLHEASTIIKKMRIISSELSSPTIAYAVAEIERLSQTTENNLLTEFTSEQEKGNLAKMRQCAKSLIEFKDKEKVADRYVWNVMCEHLAKATGESAVSHFDPIEDLDALYTRIISVCMEQFSVINRVFPTGVCDSVRELLVERLFNDPVFGILSFLDQAFKTKRYSQLSSSVSSNDFVSSSSSQDYVRLLCAAYKKTCAMVAEVEAIVRANQTEPYAREVSTKQDCSNGVNPPTKSVGAAQNNERIHAFLNLQLHSLFGSHQEKYVQTELDLLQYQFKEILTAVKFPKPPVISKSKGGTSKTKAGAIPAAASAPTPSPGASSTQVVSSVSTTSISSSNFEKDGVVSPLESSLPRVYFESLRELAEDENVPGKYAEVMNDAMERCHVILSGSELHGDLVTTIFTSFVASFGDEYQGKLVALTKELLQEQCLTSDSALQFFSITESLLTRIDFLDEQFQVHIASSLEDSPTQITICVESKQKCLDKLEQLISSGLQLALTVIERSIGQILALSQVKGDFLGGQASMSLSPSKACQKCTEYLQPLVTVISRVLIGENGANFLTSLARSFKEMYLNHLQKFRFDPDGACMLLRDVSEYRQAFRFPSLPAAIDDIFDLLHEIANVFALPAENLGGFVREGKLATLNKQTLHHVVKRRWDYKTNADKIAASLKDVKDERPSVI